MLWVQWIVEEFSIFSLDLNHFYMTGMELCRLSKEEFLHLCPPFVGEILWEHLDRLQSGNWFARCKIAH